MKTIVALLLCLNLSSQVIRIKSENSVGMPVVSSYPYETMTFLVDNDEIQLNIVRDSTSMFYIEYKIYVFFSLLKPGESPDLDIIFIDGTSVSLRASYVDATEAYYEYLIPPPLIGFLAVEPLHGFIFRFSDNAVICRTYIRQNHFVDFLKSN